jgi:hypothetical protein
LHRAGVEEPVGGQDRRRAEEQRVAILLGLGDDVGAKLAASAAATTIARSSAGYAGTSR